MTSSSPREIDTTRVLCALSELDATGQPRLHGGRGRLAAARLHGAYHEWRGRLRQHLPARRVIRSNFRPNRFLTPDRSLILCSSHGALFTRDEGLCIAGPCPGQSLRRVPVEVVGDYVMLADGVDTNALANSP